MSDDHIGVGIVGIGGRGGTFDMPAAFADRARVAAVCDIDEEALAAAAAKMPSVPTFADYETMLSETRLDAVVIGTPMPYHAPQAIAALERDIHVLSEVPAGVTIEECRALVEAANSSAAEYMMAENYIYTKPNQLVKSLVKEGLFGEVYYAEGEYLHELKELNEITPWRREWQTGINGVTYPTHSLGPILTWMPDDRVARVCCTGSGHHYVDPRGDEYEQEDTTVMLCETVKDRLIKIRLDMLSERPHAMDNYQLQGTNGCYESARAIGSAPESDGFDTHNIWLEAFEDAPDSHDYEWQALFEFEQFLPERWRDPPPEATESGHGGGDYFIMADFLDAVINGTTPPIDIHRSMDMTLPGLASQESIEQDGRWVDVPDPRKW